MISHARRRHPLAGTLSLVILLLLLSLSLVPVAMMLVWSLRDGASIQYDVWALPHWPRWGNWGAAMSILLAPIARSLYVAGLSILGITLFGCMAGYAFARLQFMGREFLFYAVLIVLLIPGVLTLVPSFVLAVRLGLRNTLEGLVLFYIGGGQALAIMILRAFFQAQPEEIFEAARLDGAGELRIIWALAVPLATPALITVAIMSFLTIYNDLMWPLLMLISEDLYTVMILLQSWSGGDPAFAMAAFLVASLPVLFMFAYGMEHYVEGLTSTSFAK